MCHHMNEQNSDNLDLISHDCFVQIENIYPCNKVPNSLKSNKGQTTNNIQGNSHNVIS